MNLTSIPSFSVYSAPEGGGGAGGEGGGTPAGGGGANANSSGAGGGQGGGGQAAAVAEAIRLSEDSLIDLGDGKGVKFGDHVRGLKSNLTKATQAQSKLQKEYEALKTQHQTAQQQLQQFQKAGGGQGSASQDIFADLRKLPYLSGEEAADVIGKVVSGINQRDQALVLMFKQLQAVNGRLDGLSGRHAEADLAKKIGSFREKLGVGEEYTDFLNELYAAYEGDDLDEEFPNIAKSRIEQLTKAIRNADKAKVAQAKQLPFVPGKGGQGTPSRPLLDKMRKASSGEIADMVWDSLQEDET